MASVQRPVKRGEYDYNELPMIGIGAASMPHPYDLTEEEIDYLVEEHENAMARKRPLGFAAWPELEG